LWSPGYGRKREFIREIARTSKATDGDKAVSELTQGSRIITGGGTPLEFATEAKWSDELVETVGWYLTEGADIFAPSGWHSATISQKKSQFVTDIRRLAEYWKQQGATFTEAKKLRDSGVVTWYLGKGVANALREAAPGKKLTPEFLTSLTYHQAQLLRKVLIDGDGTRSGSRVTWYQDDAGRKDGYQMLCAMLGIRTRQDDHIVCEYQARHILAEETARRAVEEYPETLEVWCPTVANGIWFARRNVSTYWTGNTAPVTVITGAKASNLEHASPGEPSRPVGLE
jgi:hypothetical protein